MSPSERTLRASPAAVNSGPAPRGAAQGPCYPAAVRAKWLLIIVGPALLMFLGSVAAMLYFPHPVPKRATPAQRLYLTHCATCHGANGEGSWRATLFLMRPGNLADPRAMGALSDDYLATLIKNGGAPLGKPGMPAFGYHLKDDDIREVIRHLRTLPKR